MMIKKKKIPQKYVISIFINERKIYIIDKLLTKPYSFWKTQFFSYSINFFLFFLIWKEKIANGIFYESLPFLLPLLSKINIKKNPLSTNR